MRRPTVEETVLALGLVAIVVVGLTLQNLFWDDECRVIETSTTTSSTPTQDITSEPTTTAVRSGPTTTTAEPRSTSSSPHLTLAETP